MVKIAVYSRKGGTGKTTSTFNIAGIIAKNYKKKVLIIDADSQANITTYLLQTEREQNNNSYDFLNDITTVEDLFLYPEKINDAVRNSLFALTEKSTPRKRGIDIVPARPTSISPKIDLDKINDLLASEAIPKGQINKALSMLKHTRNHLYDYDYCLMDFGPAKNKLTMDFLAACDYVLIPTSIDAASINGVSGLVGMLDDIRQEYETKVSLLGIYPTIVMKNTSYDSATLNDMKAVFGDRYIDTPIRYSTETKWSIDMGVPLAYTKRTAPVTQDYNRLVDEIIERIERA